MEKTSVLSWLTRSAGGGGNLLLEWETFNDEGDKKPETGANLGVGRKKLIVSSAKSAEFNGEINSLFSQTDTSFPQAVLPLLLDCDHFKGWQRRHEYV